MHDILEEVSLINLYPRKTVDDLYLVSVDLIKAPNAFVCLIPHLPSRSYAGVYFYHNGLWLKSYAVVSLKHDCAYPALKVIDKSLIRLLQSHVENHL